MKPKVLSSKLIYSGFFDLRQDLLQRPDGQTLPYHKVVLPTAAVIILAQDSEQRWILNREYRHPIEEVLLGTAAGALHPNEEPLVGGQRELFEETGYWSDDLTLIGTAYPFPASCGQKMYYVWAKNAQRKGPQQLEPFEFIDIELKTHEELKTAIRTSPHIDGNLIIALWYKEQFC